MSVLDVDTPAEGVRRLTLNRPESLNALNRELVERLEWELAAIDADPSVRAVILRGAGTAFCAGADLDEHFRDDGYDIGRATLWERIEMLRAPVVAAVHGWAVTGGFLLAYCSDIVVASADAMFRDTHASLGLVPTGGESQRMPRRLGAFLARDLMLTSRVLSAEEGVKAGFISRVVAREDLDEAALEVATSIAANSRSSVETIKRLINLGTQADLGVGMRLEAAANRLGAANNAPDEDRDRRLSRLQRSDPTENSSHEGKAHT